MKKKAFTFSYFLAFTQSKHVCVCMFALAANASTFFSSPIVTLNMCVCVCSLFCCPASERLLECVCV